LLAFCAFAIAKPPVYAYIFEISSIKVDVLAPKSLAYLILNPAQLTNVVDSGLQDIDFISICIIISLSV
jgi:hypothetical protein